MIHNYICWILGTAPITNGVAIVTVNGLQCEVTYTVTAGGTLNGDLVGLRSSYGTITAGPCPTCPVTSKDYQIKALILFKSSFISNDCFPTTEVNHK